MLLTHGSSFLSDALVRTLNQHNFNYLVVTDDNPNWKPPTDWRIKEHLPPTPLPDWFERNQQELEFAFCLDVADDETDDACFQTLWQQCIGYQVPLIFRTTAARSAWVAQQDSAPFFWAGLLAPNPFGPGDQGWVTATDEALRQGHSPTRAWKGKRALTYSLNVAMATYFLMRHRRRSGEYALDEGVAYSFKEATAWMKQARLNLLTTPVLPAAPTPTDLAVLECNAPFYGTEAGVQHYVQNHLGVKDIY